MAKTRTTILHYIGVNILSVIELIQWPFRVLLRLTGIQTISGIDLNWDMDFLIWWATSVMGSLKDASKVKPSEIYQAKVNRQ